MTRATALRRAEAKLASAGIHSARLDSQILLEQVAGLDRTRLLAHDEVTLSPSELERYDALVTRRAARTPIVHLTGRTEFYGLSFNITPDVLTPRAETEPMVAWAAELTPSGGRLLDIGTGCGAIAVATAKQRPDLHVSATDISERELTVARANAKLHAVDIGFITSDLLANVRGRFDTVVANLPYLRDDADLMPEVRHEPSVALFGGSDGLGLYRRLLPQLPDRLNRPGYLLTECDPWQQDQLIKLAATAGLTPIRRDYFILAFQITGSNQGLPGA